MDYKWNIYTCDVEYEYNKQEVSLFKKADNWTTNKCTISQFLKCNYTVFAIADSLDKAKEMLYEKVKYYDYIMELDTSDGHTVRKYCHQARNVNVVNVRIANVSISRLLDHYNSESVIEWLKERGMNCVVSQ